MAYVFVFTELLNDILMSYFKVLFMSCFWYILEISFWKMEISSPRLVSKTNMYFSKIEPIISYMIWLLENT